MLFTRPSRPLSMRSRALLRTYHFAIDWPIPFPKHIWWLFSKTSMKRKLSRIALSGFLHPLFNHLIELSFTGLKIGFQETDYAGEVIYTEISRWVKHIRLQSIDGFKLLLKHLFSNVQWIAQKQSFIPRCMPL